MEKNTDKIVLSRKWFYVGVSVVALLIIFLVYRGNYTMKLTTNGVELTPVIPTIVQKDTLTSPVQTPNKEQVMYRPVVNNRPSTKSASVKNGDTTVVVQDQPAIINTGTNNGLMGNNNSNVTINPKRTLKDDEKKGLIVYVDKKLKEYGKDKTTCIYIIPPANSPNPETKSFAYEIGNFLLANGYNTKPWPALNYARKIFTETTIDFYCDKDFGGCCTIEVWLN